MEGRGGDLAAILTCARIIAFVFLDYSACTKEEQRFVARATGIRGN